MCKERFPLKGGYLEEKKFVLYDLLPIFLFFSNSVEWKGLQEDDTSSLPSPGSAPEQKQ
jgi:hypothetical protein